VVQKISNRGDPRFRGGLGRFRADAVERLQPGVEDARPRPVHGRVAELGAAQLVGAGEGAHAY
jgi:hypothetical protein